ncbi:hypothetical protein OKA06_18295 [Novosphingobium sp. MW5]|nr:hypothetical protein [Novosphingobium sp. MW5]
MLDGIAVRQHLPARRQQINVNHPLTPAFDPHPAHLGLDLMQQRQQRFGRQIRLDQQARVGKIGASTGGESGGGETPAATQGYNPGPLDLVDRVIK